MKRICLAVFIIASLIYMGDLKADETISKQTPVITSRADTTPLQFGNFPEFTLTYPDRQVAVYLNVSNNNSIEHDPVLMFNAAGNPKFKDMPYIWDIEEQEDKTTVVFNISLSSPELRDKIKEHVLRPENFRILEKIKANDKWAKDIAITPDDIFIRRKKILRMTVFFLKDNETVLGYGRIDNMADCNSDVGNARNLYRLKVDFSAKNWEEFKNSKDQITAQPFISVLDLRYHYCPCYYRSIDIIKIITEAMNLERDNLENGLFQDEVNTIERCIEAKIISNLYRYDTEQRKDVSLAAQSIVSWLFNQYELTFSDLAQNSALEQRCFVYMKPLIEKYKALHSTNNKEQDRRESHQRYYSTNTRQSKKETEIENPFSIPVGCVNVGGVSNSSNTTIHDSLDKLNQEFSNFGIQFRISMDGQSFVPAKITCFLKNASSERISFYEFIILGVKAKLENCFIIKNPPVPLQRFPKEVIGD